MKKKNNAIAIAIVIFVVFTITCKTYPNKNNPYPNMEIARYANSQAYIFPNETSDKLLVIIEGSGWDSALGVKQGDKWIYGGSAYYFLPVLQNTYTVLVPEKLKRQPGQVYNEDMEDRARYTAENLLACYSESINSYLAGHSFSSIVLIGVSEGACLLPLLYEKIKNKNVVTAMVSMGYGGFSLYESYKTLSTARTGYPAEWKEMFADILDAYNPDNAAVKDTFVENYYNLTYHWFKSFIHIRPYDYYKNITIPILFVHGINDYNLPVESTLYIQENLPEKPFDYKFFRWDHQPRKKQEVNQWRKELAEWIASHS